ncbi:Imm53 family immunity protein [Labrenzia sp. DG1229]|uniref:Imm53 family immunity protein n=1 Tax=Labrenzia sp. DG1229 TaxID=681847 RepID=UPI000566E025|nr:Imm53 family immunity protein [Labrenzia sp. DG1229]
MTDISISQIEKWFAANCDGDWEHQGGLTIKTLDNPGWSVRLDLDTIEHRFDDTVSRYNRPCSEDVISSEDDFVHYSFDAGKNVLSVYCSVGYLTEVLAFILDDVHYEKTE